MSINSMCDRCSVSGTPVTYVGSMRYCKECLFQAVDGDNLKLSQSGGLRCQHCYEEIEEGASVTCNGCAQCENGHGYDVFAQYCEDCANDSESSCNACGEYDGVYCYECAKENWELVDRSEEPEAYCSECGDDASYFYCTKCDADRIWKDEASQVSTTDDGTITVGDTSVVWN